MTTAHLAGRPIFYVSNVRQRCEWCGSYIIDADLTSIAQAICGEQVVQNDPAALLGYRSWNCARPRDHEGLHGEQPEPYPTWPQGGFVRIDDSKNPRVFILIAPELNDQGSVTVPEDCCMRLPAEMTKGIQA